MFFWRKKKEEAPKEPPPSLTDASSRLDGSLEEINKKIKACEEELLAYKKNAGGASGGKQRALQVLKRKKMLENQRDSLYSTLGVVEETSHSIAAMETLNLSVNAMRAAVQTSSKLALPKIEDVEDLMEEMEEFAEQQREITEIFNANSQTVDEAELEAEFAALEAHISTRDGVGVSPAAGSAMPAAPAQGLSAQGLSTRGLHS